MLINGDCIEIMKTMPDKSVDFICTDPPYGIDFEYNEYKDTRENWVNLMTQCIPEWHRLCKGPIIFPGCNIWAREWLWKNFPPKWTICWFKGSPGHAAAVGFNDWEDLHVMGDKVHFNSHDHFFAPPSDKIDGHPCPKSLKYSKWLVKHFSHEGDTVLDPFAGSGTTLLACEILRRKWIGIELNKDYCDVINSRIEGERDQLKLF